MVSMMYLRAERSKIFQFIVLSFWEVHEKPSACHCCNVVNKTQSLLLLTSSRLKLLD